MIKGKIEFTGMTFEDARDVIAEALHRIRVGHDTGHERYESGSFHFDVDHEAPDDAR